MAAATATTERRNGARTRALGIALALAVEACGPSNPSRPSTPAAPAPAPKPSAPASALDYAPSAGLHWLAFARPAQIAADPELSAALAGLLPASRLDAYAASTGVDLRKLPAGLVAGYELGVLYVAELPSPDAARVRERFASRLTDGGIVKRVRPNIYRVSGTERDQALSLVSVENRVVALASSDLTLARVVEAYAERRLKSPTALRGAALATLPAPTSDDLVAFYAPGPFDGASLAGSTAPILASSLAAAVTVRKRTSTSLTMTATLSGDWPSEHDAQAELHRVWGHLAASPTGRLLGLDLAERVSLEHTASRLAFSVEVPIAPLVKGLRALTSANVPEIFDIIPKEPLTGP